MGAATFGLKFNVFTNEQKGVSISVYPQLEFGTPGAHSVEKGLAEPGQTVLLPVLISKEFKYLILVANGAMHKPVNDPERDATVATTVGIGRALTRKVAAMVELRAESAFDFKNERLVVLNGGLIHGVRNIVLYSDVGRSLFSDDGLGHTYVGGGMKVLISPKGKVE